MCDRKSELVGIDLFSGAGGLAEGLESAGIHIAVAIELHPQPALTHAFNHPETSVLTGDIRRLSLELLESRLKDRTGQITADVVVGGPPCQGFSTAGKKFADDPRNSLFQQFAGVVGHFLPRLFVLENVPGFADMHDGKALRKAQKLFGEMGYRMIHSVLNAAAFGVPQRRQRFVMVGWLPDKVDDFVFPEPTHRLPVHQKFLPSFEDRLANYVTVEDALEDIAFLKPGWEAHRHFRKPKSSYQSDRQNGCELIFNHLATKHRDKAVEMFQHIPEGGTISQVPKEIRTGKRTMARLDRHSISNAVLALPDDLIHYQHDRIPTVREMARLQSFDDDYVFIGKRTSGFVERRVDVPQYTQVGNAVPPLLGKAIGLSAVRHLGAKETDCRNLVARRKRHELVRGSSGFAGYTLDPAAEDEIRLDDIFGDRIALPISESDTRVSEATGKEQWVLRKPPRRGQWAPGVKPRSTPAYTLED